MILDPWVWSYSLLPPLCCRFRHSRGTRIGSFFASPNPVTAGSSMTLTARKITVANRGAAVVEVAFYARIFDLYGGSEILLGYGTPNEPGIWTANLAVGLAPGSHTLRATGPGQQRSLRVFWHLTLTVR